MKKGPVVLIAFFVLCILCNQVSARAPFAERILEFDISAWYEKTPQFFDTIILGIIFISISMLTLGRFFEERYGKVLGVIIGIAMTFAFQTWKYTKEFTIADFGPFAGIAFMIVVGIGAYKLARMIKIHETYSSLIAIVIAYAVASSTMPNLFDWLAAHPVFSWAYLFWWIALIIIIIYLIIAGFSHLFGATLGKPDVAGRTWGEAARESFADWFARREEPEFRAAEEEERELLEETQRAIAMAREEERMRPMFAEKMQKIEATLNDFEELLNEIHPIEEQLKAINREDPEWPKRVLDIVKDAMIHEKWGDIILKKAEKEIQNLERKVPEDPAVRQLRTYIEDLKGKHADIRKFVASIPKEMKKELKKIKVR